MRAPVALIAIDAPAGMVMALPGPQATVWPALTVSVAPAWSISASSDPLTDPENAQLLVMVIDAPVVTGQDEPEGGVVTAM